ncbi:MAG: hypothetical protein HRU20_20010 [Pseudomonadales bacterium]|nr:hypothetical protein [Pseudomonadales bacterium]
MLLGISTAYGFIGKPTEMGLAIVAGALGLAFSNIDRISRFKGAGFEAEMRMVHTIIDNQTEPSPEQKADAKNSQVITALENRVLKRLQKPDYTWRYAKTIAHEIKQDIATTENILKELMVKDLTKNGKGTNGEIWATTNVGKDVQGQFEKKRKQHC